jgi:proteasome lid subunit RPN8/RPN11
MQPEESFPGIVWRDVEGHAPALRPLADFLGAINLLMTDDPDFDSEHHELLVFASRECIETVYTHACRDLSREQAGILCGRAYVSERGQYYLALDTALPATTQGDSTHVKFQWESWEEIWGLLDKDSEILGWYHTHPGLGVFLSQTDMRTQENHFRAPWQIAMVVDPIQDQIGIFSGSLGLPLKQYLLYAAQSRELP